MATSEYIPWKGIVDYLANVTSAKTFDEFVYATCSEIGSLIPYDRGASLLGPRGVSYGGIVYPAHMKAYNDIFVRKLPFLQNGETSETPSVARLSRIVWQEYSGTEFASDFMLPIKIYQTIITIKPRQKAFITLSRTDPSRAFTKKDSRVLRIVSDHIDNLYSCYSKLGVIGKSTFASAELVRDRCGKLSRREAEILFLADSGLTAEEIAAKLFISRRTVETHFGNVYEKLGLRSRREVLNKLHETDDPGPFPSK